MTTENSVDDRIRAYIRTWMKGIAPEVGFWSHWLRTRGFQWPDDYARRMQAEPDFKLVPHLDGARPVRVLDVGSGPFSPVGLIAPWGKIELQACDPLAGLYAQVCAEHGVTPYVETQFAYSEALTDRYPLGYFDLVHMSNALDHSILPPAGLMSMLAVAKPGGMVFLWHSENEAEHENHTGFHQWNLTEEAGHLIAWRADERVDLTELASPYADVTTWRVVESPEIPDVIATRLIRNSAPVPTTNPHKNRFDQALLLELFALSTAPAA